MCLGCFSSLTWNYLGVRWDVMFIIYTFHCLYKFCTVCLFRCFFSNWILFRLISVIFFNFCTALLWLFVYSAHFKAINKSRHWHLSISIYTRKIYFFLTKFFEIIKHLWPIQLLCAIIWHQYHFTTITGSSMIFFFFFIGIH